MTAHRAPADDPGRPSESFPFPAYANGWFRVGLSEDLAPGDVRPVRYLGRELALFRTESGQAAVLDATCPHLGAHMGHGGRVDGDSLVCPFHAWQWNREGRCTGIPYAKHIPPAARVGAWPVVERNGFVFLWHHADGAPPEGEVPAIPEIGNPEWSGFTRLRWRIRSRTYDMGENAVDDIHFRYLHGAASLPRTQKGAVRGSRSNLSKMTLDTPRGPIEGSIESTNVPGMGLVYVRGICDTLIVITGTPVDGEYVDQMFSYTQKRGQDRDRERLGKALLRDLEKQMNEDVVMFEHKRYWKRPLLVPEDGPIAEYRRTARQHYTGDFSAMLDDDEAVPRRPPADGAAPAFDAAKYEELASFLRSLFRVRRVERSDCDDGGGVELRLLGRGDALCCVLRFDRAVLEEREMAEIRGFLAQPLVRRRVAAAGIEPFPVGNGELRR